MRHLMLTTALVLAATAAAAEDIALVLGIDRYEELGRVTRGADVTVATSGLSALGFDVSVLREGNATQINTLLHEFVEAVPEAERIVIVLSGRFATDGDRTWYLTANATDPRMIIQDRTMVPVESLLKLLEDRPGQALLILAASDPQRPAQYDPWLSEGVGDLSIPQGVTVLRGQPADVAAFMRGALSEPEGDLRAAVDNSRLNAQGWFPRNFRFMPEIPAIARPEVPVPDQTAADEALWRRVLAQYNVDAYRGYLRQFPAGRHVAEAEAAISAILAEPFRDERIAEEALNLTRDQRRGIQADLTTMGFNTRGVDGIFGSGSRSAITNWQQENGFAQTGYLTTEQINRLDAQAARREAEQQAEAERQRQEAERLDRAYWDETGARGDEAGLRAYLSRYPSGLFAETANDELARIAAQRQQEGAARDRAAWNAARDQDTPQAYRTYLRDHPQGAFVAEARARVQAIEGGAEIVVPVDPNRPEPPAESAETTRARQVEEALGLNALTARLVESRLSALGHDPGEVDGRFDNATRRALRAFQEANGITPTGYLDERTMVTLLAGALQ